MFVTLVDDPPQHRPPPPLPPPPPSPRPSTRRGRLVGAAAACAALSAGVAYTTVRLTEPASSTAVTSVPTGNGAAGPATGTGTADIHQLLAQVEPAVAAIEIADGTGASVTPVAAGSGVVISNDGLMLTNAHVVQVTDQLGQTLRDPVITVKMFDGTVRSAKVLGASTDYDVALLRLDDISDLHPLALADTATMRVGDQVVAIGNALDLGDAPTVSTGIISALDRSLRESATVTLHGLIQTDAAINHGNSGGALVNMAGELIGLNSAGISDAQNIGFAISVGTIKPLLDDLKAGKNVQAAPIGFIGVNVAETPYGVTVTTVQAGTPAADVGLTAGDVIKEVDGKSVETANQLSNVLRQLSPGTDVSITIERNGKTSVFDLTLSQRPDQ